MSASDLSSAEITINIHPDSSVSKPHIHTREGHSLYNEVTFDINGLPIIHVYYKNSDGENIYIDSPYVCRSAFDNLIGVKLFVPRDVIDWSFLEAPRYAYWLFVFNYLKYKPLEEVYFHMIYTAHLEGTLETFTLLNFEDAYFEAAYQSLLEQTVHTLNFEFLQLPECKEWADAFETLNEQTYASLFKIILCKAYQTQMLRFMNPNCIAEGTLDRQYKMAIFRFLPVCLNMPYLFALHNIKSIFDFTIIDKNSCRCDERCYSRSRCELINTPAFHAKPDIYHPEHETARQYYSICQHIARKENS